MWLVISTILSKMKDISTSPPVTYNVKCGNILEMVPDSVIVNRDQ